MPTVATNETRTAPRDTNRTCRMMEASCSNGPACPTCGAKVRKEQHGHILGTRKYPLVAPSSSAVSRVDPAGNCHAAKRRINGVRTGSEQALTHLALPGDRILAKRSSQTADHGSAAAILCNQTPCEASCRSDVQPSSRRFAHRIRPMPQRPSSATIDGARAAGRPLQSPHRVPNARHRAVDIDFQIARPSTGPVVKVKV